MQLKVLFGAKSHDRPDCQKEKQQQSRVFFGVIFYVYTNVDNRERAILEPVIENKGDEFRRKKNMEIQSGGEKMRNAVKNKSEHEHRKQNIG